MPSSKVSETTVEFDEFGLVKNYCCPGCGSQVKLSHVDDVGTKFFKCEKCGQVSSRLRTLEKTQLLEHLSEVNKPLTVDDLTELLGSTVKHDDENKVITFLTMLLTYTEDDQLNIGFLAQSSTGKSYIPLELAWYFPSEDTLEYGYSSPTSFFHDYGIPLPDPTDLRDVENEKKRKRIHINLHQKILCFLDQPHAQLLERLRPLLSHDRKQITFKITDRREKSGLRTKTVVLEGFPTVIFCAAKFNMEDQEKTRLLMLSPETHQEKLRETIALRIEREGDRKGFQEWAENDPKRKVLKERVHHVKNAGIKYINVPEELREQIYEQFLEDHKHLIPRHQRDINRLLNIMKGHALLNYMHREKIDNETILINDEDIEAGFKLYYTISESNELGVPPEIYHVFQTLNKDIGDEGITIKDFQAAYYRNFHKPLGYDGARNIIRTLTETGLFIEDIDPVDRRLKRYYIPSFYTNNDKNNKKLFCAGGGGIPNNDVNNDVNNEKTGSIRRPRTIYDYPTPEHNIVSRQTKEGS